VKVTLVAPCEMAGVANETPAAPRPATPKPFSTPRREIIDLLQQALLKQVMATAAPRSCVFRSIISKLASGKSDYAKN